MKNLKLDIENVNDCFDKKNSDLCLKNNISKFNNDEYYHNKMNSGDSIYTCSTIFSSDKSSRSSINLNNFDNSNILLKNNNDEFSTNKILINSKEELNSVLSINNDIRTNIKDNNKLFKLINDITLIFINKLLPNLTIQDFNRFILAYLAYMVLYSTRKPFSVVKLQIQEDLLLSTSILGWIDTTFLGTYALGQLLVPTLFESAKINEYVSISFILSGIACLTFGMSNNSTTLIISWFFNGLFHSGVYPMLVKYLISCFGINERGRILGIWTTSQQLGAIISTAFSASICVRLGWRFIFQFLSLLVIFFGFIIYKYLKIPENQCNYNDIYIKDNDLDINNLNNTNNDISVILIEEQEININNHNNILLSSSSSLSETNIDLLVYEDNIINDNNILLKEEGKFDEKILNNEDIEIFENNNKFILDEQITDKKISLDERINSNLYTYNTELSPTIKKKYSTKEREKSKSKNTSNNDNYSSFCIQNIENTNVKKKLVILLNIDYIFNISISYFFIKLIRYSLLFWLPYYLIRELDYDQSIAGYSSMLFDIGGILGAISAGAIADIFFDGKRILVACYMSIFITISILCFILVTKTEFDILILFGIIFMGFCISGPDSILGSTAAQDIIDSSGSKAKLVDSMATGVVNGLGSLGAVTQGTLTAYISEYYGWNTLFLCLLIFAILSFFILLPVSLNKKHKITV